MVEDVIIVLNEQQGSKEALAVNLEKNLTWRKLVTSRLTPCRNIQTILAERSPKIIVTDYLLGAYGTAIELLESEDLEEQKIIVWTDEPGISSAVQAMKLGAVDYIDQKSSKSLEKLIKAIESTLEGYDSQDSRPKSNTKTGRNFVTIGQSQAFKETLASAESLANQPRRPIVVYGPPGSGRSHIARHIHNTRPGNNYLLEHNLDEWFSPLEELIPSKLSSAFSGEFNGGVTLVLDHCEFDTAGIIEWLQNQVEENYQWNRIILGTSCNKTLQALKKICNAMEVRISPLEERASDFYPLIQHFLRGARDSINLNDLEFSQDLVKEMIQLSWPGNVRDLKSCVIDSSATPVERLEDLLSADGGDPAHKDLKTSEKFLLAGIIYNQKRLEKSRSTGSSLDSSEVVGALKQAGGNPRIAAAMLGRSVQDIQSFMVD